MSDLNQLLRGWSDRQEPTSSELDQLQSRIIERLTDNEKVDRSPSRDRTDVGVRSTGRIAVIVVAASLLAVVSAFWPGDRNKLEVAAFPAGNASGRQTLFNELDRMFDGRWRWLSEVNGRLHLQTDESSQNASKDPGVAVRLTVVQRRPGQTNWTVVWEASVLAHSEEWVRLPVELTGDNIVSIWSHAMPDGSVLVESDVELTTPVSMRLTEPHIFGTSSQPARLWSARRSDGDFQLIQSIARLEANHG